MLRRLDSKVPWHILLSSFINASETIDCSSKVEFAGSVDYADRVYRRHLVDLGAISNRSLDDRRISAASPERTVRDLHYQCQTIPVLLLTA